MSGIRQEVAALKRKRILEAAVQLFYEQGYENTTLDEVAQRIDVTKPFIYSYFDSKAKLLAAICERGIASSLAEMDAVLARDLSGKEALQELGRLFTRAVIDSRMYLAIFSREEKNLEPADYDRISAMRRDFDRKLNTILQRGIDEGSFEVADRGLAALAIGGMVSWSWVWFRENRRLSGEEVAQLMSDLILKLVAAPPRSVASQD